MNYLRPRFAALKLSTRLFTLVAAFGIVACALGANAYMESRRTGAQQPLSKAERSRKPGANGTGMNAAAAAAPPNVVYVDDDFTGANGTDPDGAEGPATEIGYDAFPTVQGGIDGVAPGGTVNVLAGTYHEDVVVNKPVTLHGAGMGVSTISGPSGGPATTLNVTASNVVINNFTITRDGNSAATWNDPLNTAGIAIQGQAITGTLIHDNLLTGNRTAIDINNSNGHTIRNNSITFNRTGLLLRNQTDSLTVVENFITNNWTVGVLFLDGSGTTNNPPQSAVHSGFNNNDLSGNWYGEVADRQTGGSIPSPGTSNLKNFRNNWFGTTSPVVTTDNTMEPGYAAQIPVEYGGSATNPGGAPDIAGPASANIKYMPFLLSGTDTNVETTPGRGTNGFQGQQSERIVWPPNQNGWVIQTSGTSTATFVHGPATPPLGVGSGQLSVGSNGGGAAQFRQTNFNGTPLSDLTELSYSTYTSNDTTAPSTGDQTVYIMLNLDLDGDGSTTVDSIIFFEPEYQHGYTTAVPDQGDNVLNTWQRWDARNGGWWSTTGAGGANPGSDVKPLSAIIAAFPNARILNSSAGNIRVVAGFGAGSWDNFVGNVDKVTIGVNALNTTYDFEPLPQLTINDVTHAEGDSGTTAYDFTVTLSRAVDVPVSFTVATADDTATAPSDYAAVSPTPVTIPAGQTSAPVTVQVNGDGIYEPNEQFFVNLSNPSNATILDGQGTGTITNDDPLPAVTIDDVQRNEGNAGVTFFTFTLSLSRQSYQTVTLTASTADGTATAPSDYTAITNQAISFPPFETIRTVTVQVNGDTAFEENETFFVNLTNVMNATVADGQGLGTITNDDAPGTTLVVNTTNDVDDGACLQSHCSLREAINAANLSADANTISFQIPATDPRHFYYADDLVAGQVSLFTVTTTTATDDSTITNIDPDWPHSWWSIRPGVAGLPNITNPVTLDGYTQTGATVNTSSTIDNAVLRLELNGTTSGASVDGFRLITRNSVVRGFSINRFPSDGIVLKEDVDAANDGDSNAVRGNFIGTDVSGTLDLGNGAHGITTEVDNTSHNSDTNTIGGTLPADRNLISGNNGHGILMTFSSGNIIRGNIIGLAADGSTALGNTGAGVEVTNSTIGGDDNDDGTADGIIRARNVISANGASGIQFVSTGASTVQGNYIGTDATGTLDRGNAGSGINSSGFSKNIGGTDAGAGNLISGNDAHGILLSGGNGNLVFGNFIGTQADGTTALPNAGNGVILTSATIFNTIGGVNAGESNLIAFNGGDGINLDPTAGANNALRGNSIHSNGTTAAHLGIDLGADGITPNDPQDPDTGANNLQNFPVLTSATVTGSTKKITGTLNSTPDQIFTIDFYVNTSCDTSGNGEGQTYIGSVTTGTTDANGDVAFSFNPSALTLGQIITATAINNLNSTSEFSACVAVMAGTPGDIRFTSATYTVAENAQGGAASITVERVGGADGQITSNFSTADGTATAGQDYTAVTNHTVTFNDGETGTKTVNVPIIDDNVHEGDETVNLSLGGTTVNIAGQLSAVGNGALNAVLTITDAEDTPAISINDAFVSEPPAPGTSNAVFTVSLSNPSNTTVTVDYQTADGTANAPADYNPVPATTLTFEPGQTTKTVNVTVNYDTLTEGNETFSVNLSNPSANATIADGTGTGTITDPVAEGQLLISEFRFRGATYNANGGVDGSRDEFIELYNNTDEPLTVSTTDGSAGWTVAALSGDGMSAVPLVTIEAGTVIPPRAHYLCANSDTPVNPATGGYSLGGYAAPDQLYLPDIADNAGVAVFTTATPANFSLGNRLDAAGFSGTQGATAELFREGAGLASPGANDGEYAFVRKLLSGLPQDTDVNADDFFFVSTDGGLYGGVQSQLGAPAPENKPTSPVQRNASVKASLIDGTVSGTAPPNRVRSGQVQPGVPNAYGTLSIQRRFKNTLAVPITRLRFRVVDITTLNTPVVSSPQADLRVLSSTGVVTNSQGQEVVTVTGLTLETPPAQPNGGGLNSSLTVIPPGGQLAPGASIDVQFLLGVEQQGSFRFLVNVEALPGASNAFSELNRSNLRRGNTKTGNGKQKQ
ncbi:MAG TPA: Calx-beta domain-containing protein [Pyrinomonadaceae bacterium]|nr:Calx-beta domain-containing protein [Pyrinomonadaceae bacterium]